jgi:hypothetical protein
VPLSQNVYLLKECLLLSLLLLVLRQVSYSDGVLYLFVNGDGTLLFQFLDMLLKGLLLAGMYELFDAPEVTEKHEELVLAGQE